jgi:hypothetical protein
MTPYEDVCVICTARQSATAAAAAHLWTKHAAHTKDAELRDVELERAHDALAGVWHALRPPTPQEDCDARR